MTEFEKNFIDNHYETIYRSVFLEGCLIAIMKLFTGQSKLRAPPAEF